MSERPLDLVVVGAGPTGIAIGAAATAAGLDVLVVDRGGLTASIQGYPTYMTFFSTREQLEIAGVPFAIPEPKPTRRQALAYYRAVAERHRVPLALYEEVVAVERPGGADGGEPFAVRTVATAPAARDAGAGEVVRRARAVALASGYFNNPGRLGVPGEDRPWVSHRYVEPYPHYGGRVVVVGAGNSAAEAALDLWRAGARVTLVCRGAEVRGSVKYWLKPDLENRVRDGAIDARFRTEVAAFTGRGVAVRPTLGPLQGQVHGEVEDRGADPAGSEVIPADAAYVLIGYRPDTELAERSGVAIDPVTRVPVFDPETLESNVPGLYVAGTLQAGCATDKIFIENTRDHGEKIVRHLTGSG